MKFNVFCKNDKTKVLLDISEDDNGSAYASNIDDAILQAEQEIKLLDETIETVNTLKPQCDKIDYALAASSGALCGLLDVFLVATPDDSFLGNVTDKWFEERTCDFAKLCGWEGNSDNPVKSAIGYLERTFNVPYDQRGCGDAGSIVFGLTPSNHHFKSLAHNPSLLGLFFSVLNQFTNTSHFVSDGQLVSLQEADGKFELRGNNFISKLWCGIVNWIGHLMSDISGASGSKLRGTGIPSPLWTWTNSVIAIKAQLGLSANEFDKSVNELALNLFNEGYDARFQTAQAIPVLINELIVRLLYIIRRLIKYYKDTPKTERSFKSMWEVCEPFKNLTVKRMLTVAHGTFCLIDAADAVVRGFITGGVMFNPVEFFLRLNLVGVGRLTISLYGENELVISYHRAQNKAASAKIEKIIVEDYIEGLKLLQSLYKDKEYFACIKDLIEGRYLEAFKKSQAYAKSQGVPEPTIIMTKTGIDKYFLNQTIMDNKKTPLQIESDKVQELVRITNNKILELGVYSQFLYDALVTLQALFNRIRNTPEDKQIELNRIKECVHNWKNQVEKIERDYEVSRTSVKAGAAGAAMGVGLATLGPTAAMGIATTFGVASTGTAISTLSGVAATNAALAWLGGGTLAAGGGGIAAGQTLITLAGPVGWGIAIAAFAISGFIFWSAKKKKERLEEIFMLISKRDQESYRLAILELDERMKKKRKVTGEIYEACIHVYTFGTDYKAMTEEQQYTLGTYLNLMNAATQLLINPIIGLQPKFREEDLQTKCDGNVQISQINSDNITHVMKRLQEWNSSKDSEKYKNLIVFLANMFYDINFQKLDYGILVDVFKDDKEFCEKMDIDKEIIDDTLFMIVDYKLAIAKFTKKK